MASPLFVLLRGEPGAEAPKTAGKIGRRQPHLAQAPVQKEGGQWPQACVCGGPHQRRADPGFLLRFSAHCHHFSQAVPQTWREPSHTPTPHPPYPPTLPTPPPPEQPARYPVCLIRFKPHLLREALPG